MQSIELNGCSPNSACWTWAYRSLLVADFYTVARRSRGIGLFGAEACAGFIRNKSSLKPTIEVAGFCPTCHYERSLRYRAQPGTAGVDIANLSALAS